MKKNQLYIPAGDINAFNPIDQKFVSEAVMRALELNNNNHGHNNKDLAIKNWSIDKIAEKYMNLYMSLKS